MMRSARAIIGYEVEATDGIAGRVIDALFDDQFLWIFEHRDAYALPDDAAASTREVFPMTPRDGVRIYGLWLPAAANVAYVSARKSWL